MDSISRDDVMLYADAQIYILIREGSIKIFCGFNKQDIGKNGAEWQNVDWQRRQRLSSLRDIFGAKLTNNMISITSLSRGSYYPYGGRRVLSFLEGARMIFRVGRFYSLMKVSFLSASSERSAKPSSLLILLNVRNINNEPFIISLIFHGNYQCQLLTMEPTSCLFS